jgi:hypothetical protein
MTRGVDRALAHRLVSRRPEWIALLVPAWFQRTRTHHDAGDGRSGTVVRFGEEMRWIAPGCVGVGRDYESVARAITCAAPSSPAMALVPTSGSTAWPSLRQRSRRMSPATSTACSTGVSMCSSLASPLFLQAVGFLSVRLEVAVASGWTGGEVQDASWSRLCRSSTATSRCRNRLSPAPSPTPSLCRNRPAEEIRRVSSGRQR